VHTLISSVVSTPDQQLPGGSPSISVVTPVYNSAPSLQELVHRLEAVLRDTAAVYELILVNDGSRDHSIDVIRELASSRPWIVVIDLMRNYGQHNALLCGIRQARYDVIVTIDDDLQHPPEEIPTLLAGLDDDTDVVYGTPLTEQHGVLRDVSSQVTKLALQSAMGAPIARKVSAFRAFRTELRDAFAAYDSAYVSIDVLLTWGTTRFAAVNVRHDPRSQGPSNYTYRNLMTHALNMVTGFSAIPLQIASLLGFGFTIFGGAILLFVVGRYFIQGSVAPGFPFLASMIAIFSGVQLFALGIIGEYLARMHFRTLRRPIYVVRRDNPSPNSMIAPTTRD